ncbi:MAG: hypothetical protein V5A55_13040 [Halovenus sp.]
MIRRLLAGWVSPGDVSRLESTDADIRCPRCDTPAKVSYYSGIMRAHCPRCADGIAGDRERTEVSGYHPGQAPFLGMSVPPTGLVGENPAEAFRAAFVYFYSRVRTHLAGSCPTCARRVTSTIDIQGDPAPTTDTPELERHDPLALVRTVCSTCKTHVTVPVRRAIQTQPAVAAFYHERGIDHRFLSWRTYRQSWTYDEEVLSEDPVRVRVTVPCDDERLKLTVNEELSVLAERRHVLSTS